MNTARKRRRQQAVDRRLPVIDGRDAVTRTALNYWNESRGVIKVGGASMLLGRDYRVEGRVVSGKKRGRTIGTPTANVDPVNEILPRRGVSAAMKVEDQGHGDVRVDGAGNVRDVAPIVAVVLERG